MEIGIYMDTHGVGIRDEKEWWLESIPAGEMRPVEFAQLAERSGCHSLWFPDHVTLPLRTTNMHSPTGRRHYPEKPDMLDAQVTMGAVAAATTTIKLATQPCACPPPGSSPRAWGWTRWILSDLRARICGVASPTTRCVHGDLAQHCGPGDRQHGSVRSLRARRPRLASSTER